MGGGTSTAGSEAHIWLAAIGPAMRAGATGRPGRETVVRRILSPYLDRPPKEVRLGRRCAVCGGSDHGRLVLPDCPDVALSCASSEGLMVVALSAQPAIGVDVEAVSSRPVDLIGTLLAPEERRALAAVPDISRMLAFHKIWTRKEAAVKASGLGLTLALDGFAVSPPFDAARIVRVSEACAALADIKLVDLEMAPGWAGALAYRGASRAVRLFAMAARL
jgi:4'-phosphopantetheinyl transferase